LSERKEALRRRIAERRAEIAADLREAAEPWRKVDALIARLFRRRRFLPLILTLAGFLWRRRSGSAYRCRPKRMMSQTT